MAIAGPLKISLQLLAGDEPAMGPGKALVLDAIARSGSISAAGRDIGMSYRRTWQLVDSLNRLWAERVVETHYRAGAKRGAELTPFGQRMLTTYREIEARMLAAAAGDDLDWLVGLTRPGAKPVPGEV